MGNLKGESFDAACSGKSMTGLAGAGAADVPRPESHAPFPARARIRAGTHRPATG